MTRGTVTLWRPICEETVNYSRVHLFWAPQSSAQPMVLVCSANLPGLIPNIPADLPKAGLCSVLWTLQKAAALSFHSISTGTCNLSFRKKRLQGGTPSLIKCQRLLYNSPFQFPDLFHPVSSNFHLILFLQSTASLLKNLLSHYFLKWKIMHHYPIS